MANRQLSDKVEHCPSCGSLKSKVRPCKKCGYGKTSARQRSIMLKFGDVDMRQYDYVIINGIEFHK